MHNDNCVCAKQAQSYLVMLAPTIHTIIILLVLAPNARSASCAYAEIHILYLCLLQIRTTLLVTTQNAHKTTALVVNKIYTKFLCLRLTRLYSRRICITLIMLPSNTRRTTFDYYRYARRYLCLRQIRAAPLVTAQALHKGTGEHSICTNYKVDQFVRLRCALPVYGHDTRSRVKRHTARRCLH